MKVLNIEVDELPDNCLECVFNQTKYCSLKMAMSDKGKYEYGNTFVQNNRETVDKRCPLKKEGAKTWLG